MGAELVVQHNADRCPKCNSGMVDALAEDEGIRRYQCRGCGHLYAAIIGNRNFGDVAGEPVARIPDDPRLKSKTPYRADPRVGEELEDSPFRRTALEARRKEAVMAEVTGDLLCAKGCGKTCGSGAGKAKHERYCDGTPKAEKPARARKARRKAVRTRTSAKAQSGTISGILDLLKSNRQERIDFLINQDPEIRDLDVAIKALSGRPT